MSHFAKLLAAWLDGSAPPPPIVSLLGFSLEGYEKGVATVAFEAERRHHNALGTLHGGVLCDLADVAMGVALATRLEDGEGFTTLNLQTTFLESVRTGRLVATGRVVRRGRRTAYCECDVTDAAGELVSRTTSSCLVFRASG